MDAAWTDLVDEATAERARRAADGSDESNHLTVRDLKPGDLGVLSVTVRHVHAPKAFSRKDGSQGMLRRVTLGDGTGEVDMVLWGDECQQAIDGPLTTGTRLVLRGATVKEGWRGGVELQLGGAVVEVAGDGPAEALEGELVEVSETRIVGTPPDVRFQCDARIATADGEVNVVLWDAAVKQVRAVLPGGRVRVEGCVANPALDGWFVAEQGSVRAV